MNKAKEGYEVVSEFKDKYFKKLKHIYKNKIYEKNREQQKKEFNIDINVSIEDMDDIFKC